MPDDVGARFVHAQNHEDALFLCKWERCQKFAYELTHQSEVRGVGGKLNSLFHQAFQGCVRRRIRASFVLVGNIITRMSERNLDSRKKALFSLPMRKIFFALLFVGTNVLAQEYPTAYNALRVVGTQFSRDTVNHVVSVTGTDGRPQPKMWKVL